jgi:hypothetical protein
MKRTIFPLTILASLMLLAIFPYRAARTEVQKESTFVVKGSLLVSAPINQIRRSKSAEGYRFSGTANTKPSLDRLEFDGTLQGQRLDPNSKAIRSAVEQAIQSQNWTLDDNSTRVEAQVRARSLKAAQDMSAPDIKAWAQSRVRQPAVSFDFAAQGSTKFRSSRVKATGTNLAVGDEGMGEGVITGFRSTVPELRALNGARILVKAKYHVDQVDASGFARGRIDFELRSEK